METMPLDVDRVTQDIVPTQPRISLPRRANPRDIARRAYDLPAAGGEQGDDLNDWFRADTKSTFECGNPLMSHLNGLIADARNSG